jgi:hypothetical protein
LIGNRLLRAVTWVAGFTALAIFSSTSSAMAATTPAPSPSPTAPAEPILNLTGGDAAWFVGSVFGIMVLAAVAVVWRNGGLNQSAQNVIDKIVNQPSAKTAAVPSGAAGGEQPRGAAEGAQQPAAVPPMAVSDRVQLLKAIQGQVGVRDASKGATRAAIALMIISLAALALAATLISGAPDAPSLRNTIVSALLATLATVAGFYFGAKTAQDNQSPSASAAPADPGTSNGTPKGTEALTAPKE